MNDLVKILLFAIGMAVLDVPWLVFQGSRVETIVRDIQGGKSMNVRLWGGIPVYLALGYLLTQQPSAPRAFLAGLCVYAVYDWTQVVTFDLYPIDFAIADTLWGGLLMAFSWWLANRLGLL